MTQLDQHIISFLELENLNEQKKEQLLKKLNLLLKKRVAMHITDVMSEEQLKKASEIDHSQPEETMTYLKMNVPQFDNILKVELQKLKEELLTIIKQ